MSAILLMAVLLCILCVLITYGSFEKQKSKKALTTTRNDCDAGCRLTIWRLKNPGIKPGSCPGGTLLVEQAITAKEEFLKTHPYIKDEKSLEILYSQL